MRERDSRAWASSVASWRVRSATCMRSSAIIFRRRILLPVDDMPMSFSVSCVRSSSTSPVMSLSIIGDKEKWGLGWVLKNGLCAGGRKKRKGALRVGGRERERLGGVTFEGLDAVFVSVCGEPLSCCFDRPVVHMCIQTIQH